MTQPVQEPLTQRSISGLKWTDNQLLRRPAPPGAGTRWPWIVLENGGQTLPGDAAFDPSIMGVAYWDPTLVTQPELGMDATFSLDILTFDSQDYWSLITEPEGWYLIDMAHTVFGPSPGTATEYFQQNCTLTPDPVIEHDAPFGNAQIWNPIIEGALPRLETARIIWVSPTTTWTPQVRQNTGSDCDLDGHLKVFYLGGVGGGIDNTEWIAALASS